MARITITRSKGDKKSRYKVVNTGRFPLILISHGYRMFNGGGRESGSLKKF
ncbi:MAG: hypothetical protein HY471_02245 [Candidatus Sungbacteria bacterium]|nr:hypothetical protein [Candidatus Sungbacteria bacterium]